jgi:2-dehydropantoate 2-reductase
MRILILGAGGTGGYFGGRLVQAGADVTFLVRPARAAKLRADGLVIRSPLGNAALRVAVVEQAALAADYDLVILGCKAYDLDDAVAAVTPAMRRPGVTLLPLLNGLAHYETLDAAFGRGNVLGGLCHISATLNAAGEVEHLNKLGSVTFGERDAGTTASGRCARIVAAFAPAAFESRHSADIHADLWEKYAFLCAAAALTCLMRASVGDIVATAEGERIARALIAECEGIARASGYPTSAKGQEFAEKMLTTPRASFKASMLRDIEAGRRVEADHLVGDMLRRGRETGQPTALLEVAYAQLKAYEHGL